MKKILETKRLRLRPWTLEDLPDFYEYSKDFRVGPNAGWKPHESLEESQKILERWIREEDNDIIFAVEYRENGKVIGSVGLHEDRHRPFVPDCRMLGYVLSADYWGNGLMTEAVSAVIPYAFEELKLWLLTVVHFSINERSKRVIEKCGFQYEGKLRCGSVTYNGTVTDDCCYSMTRREYLLEVGKEEGYQLLLPEELSERSLLEYQEAWGEEPIVPAAVCRKDMPHEKWLAENIRLRQEAPAPLVTATTFFLADKAGTPLGALDLRHQLTESLLATGGHIGYGIRPSCRGQKLAPVMLALGLEKARKFGIKRVLITCADDNLPSAATIEACGGILENKLDMESGIVIRRYWITI